MASVSPMQLVNEHGWRRGLANLLRKENGQWWHTRRWWVQSLTWLVIVNGILAIGLWVVPIMDPEEAVGAVENLGIFIQLMLMFPMFGVIVGMQGAIIDEKQSGTAAWILSAPVSRSAFVLAKLMADAFGFLVTIVLLQGLVAYVQLSLSDGNLLALPPYLADLGLISLYLLFYLALTLMLGTFFDNRGPVLGIAIGFAIASLVGISQLIGSFAPGLVFYLPEALAALVKARVAGESLPPEWPIPIIAVSVYVVVFVALAIWRFNREEF